MTDKEIKDLYRLMIECLLDGLPDRDDYRGED